MVDPLDTNQQSDLVEVRKLATTIVSAYVGNNAVTADALPSLINAVFSTLHGLGGTTEEKPEPAPKPAVPIKKSIQEDHLVCLEDGKKLKMLKRHLRTAYNMSPEEYRTKWGLPHDYPMVAPAYARQRSEFAKKIGLGRRGNEDES